MNIQSAYNNWSSTYDEDKNLTRDLDADIVRNEFCDSRFDSILEVGSGTGKNTIFFSEIAKKVYALDFSERMISIAKEKVKAKNVAYTQTDITKKWPIKNNSIDLITCNLILEHIENLDFVFYETRRCLNKQGKLFINELHPYRQYEGKKATFNKDGKTIEIDAFVHNISDFLNSAETYRFKFLKLSEFWQASDKNNLPRILSLLFSKD
jgi:malonyl-CoA O-methyltransferase